MAKLIDAVNEALWGPWTVALVLLAGLLFSIRSRFFQVVGARLWLKETIGSAWRKKKNMDGISPLQSACTALAGTLGIGNIFGVAAALAVGGAGAVFWMWVAALFGMMSAFTENTLGVLYRVRDEKGEWLGGPMLYIEKGLKNKPLALCWSLACMLAAFGVGNLTQVNSIAQSAESAWGVPAWAVGLVVAAAAAPAILGGVKGVARFAEMLVPIMAALYFLACFAVLGLNFSRIPAAFGEIFSNIFTPSAAGGGVLGAMLLGVRRGVFSNEAGLGSAVMVHAAADCDEPAVQGLWGIFEVFIDTIVTCTLTALVILTTTESYSGANAAKLCIDAFSLLFGGLSGSFLTIILLLFAFATLIAWSLCGERAFASVFGAKYSYLYRLAYVLLIIPGCFLRARTAWALSDILNALMAIPNTIALLLLWSKAGEALRQFKEKRKYGNNAEKTRINIVQANTERMRAWHSDHQTDRVYRR